MIKKIFFTILLCCFTSICFAEHKQVLLETSVAKGMMIEDVLCIKHNARSYITFTKWKADSAVKEFDKESEYRMVASFVHTDDDRIDSYDLMYKNINGIVFYSVSKYNYSYRKLEDKTAAEYFYKILKNN